MCALPIPFPAAVAGTAYYTNVAEAQTAINNDTDGCVGWLDLYNFAGQLNKVSFSSSWTENSLTLAGETSRSINLGAFIVMYGCITVSDDSQVVVDFDYHFPGAPIGQEYLTQFALYPCGTVDPGDLVVTTIRPNPNDGGILILEHVPINTYVIAVVCNQDGGPTFVDNVQVSFTITSDKTMTINPVVALYDDSGTTRQLEACPKMILPPLGERVGDWYASLAEAQSILDNNVLDCFTFIDPIFFTPPSTITSSVGQVNLTSSSWDGGGMVPWFSVNLIQGQSVTATSSISSNAPTSGGAVAVSISIMDYDWASLAADGRLTPNQVSDSISVSITAPYTGKYIIKGTVYSNDSGIHPPLYAVMAQVKVTASSITNNPIQALYDVGLDCPARLDCH